MPYLEMSMHGQGAETGDEQQRNDEHGNAHGTPQYTGTRGGTALRRVANSRIVATPTTKPPAWAT